MIGVDQVDELLALHDASMLDVEGLADRRLVKALRIASVCAAKAATP
jgi:hypothetical protein